MLHATAFCPANISLIFETYPAEPPHGRGSLGVGITLEAGVTAKVCLAPGARESVILVGGEAWEFPTVRQVLRKLSPVPLQVELEAAFPFGCGFGMSGASALSVALAVDALGQSGKSREELGMTAHQAEVDQATGLGDVGGQFNGGIMIKTRPHRPLQVDHLPIPPQTLHYRIHGPILTREVINSTEKLQRINAAGHSALAAISHASPPVRTLKALFEISYQFAVESGLLASPQVAADIAAAQAAGHAATMIMLGNAVISTGPFPGSHPVEIGYGGAEVRDVGTSR